jgi:hypothetical protein
VLPLKSVTPTFPSTRDKVKEAPATVSTVAFPSLFLINSIIPK